MPLPASLVASVVSAILETASQNVAIPAKQYDMYIVKRVLPPEAKVGVMQPPLGDGHVTIDGKELTLSPVAQFRNPQNLIIVPMTIKSASDVVYLNDNYGSVNRVWLLSQAEADSLKDN